MIGLRSGILPPCKGIVPALAMLLALLVCAQPGRADEPGADRESLRDFTNAEVVRTMLTQEERRRRSLLRAEQARAYYEAGRYADALEEYRRALQLDPENEAARTGKAQTLRFIAARPDVVGSAMHRLRDQEHVDQQHRLAEAEQRLARAESILVSARQAPRSEVISARIAEYQEKLTEIKEAIRTVEAANLQIKTITKTLDTSELEQRVHRVYVEIARLRPEYEAQIKTLKEREAVRQIEGARDQRTQIAAAQRETLFEQARMYRDNMAWDRAESILLQILEMNAADQEANSMLQDIRRMRRRFRTDNIEDLVEEHRRLNMLEIDKATILQVSPQNPLRYPRDWDMISSRRDARQIQETDPQNRAILTALESTYSFAFIDTPITDAFDMIRNRTGLAFILRLNGAEGRTLNLDLRDMRLDNILRWIMRDTGLAYQIRRGAIFVTTPDALEGEMVTEVYDVRDIAYAVTDAHAPRDFNEDEEYDVEEGGINTVELSDIVQTVLADDFSGRGEINYDPGSGMLTILHTHDVQRKVVELLGKLRSAQAIQVAVAARFLTVRDDFWEEFNSNFYDFNTYGFNHPGVDEINNIASRHVREITGQINDVVGSTDYLGPTEIAGNRIVFAQNQEYQPRKGYGTMRGLVHNGSFTGLNHVLGIPGSAAHAGMQFHIMQNGWLGPLQNQWFVQMLKQSSRTDQLFSPHLIAYNNRYAWIRFRRNMQYIHTWRRAAAGGGLEADRRYLRLGSMLQVRPSVSADRKYITVDIWPRTSQLTDRDRRTLNAWAPYAMGRMLGQFPIDLPTVLYHDTRTIATLPDGGAIVLNGMGVNVRSRQRIGIPLIQDAPLVGNVFSSRAYQQERQDYILVVSARMIILEEEEAKFKAF